jgi:putative membrane protein
VLGGGIGAAALVGLDERADERLSAHMLQHVLVGDLAPLLIVLALGGGVAAVLPTPAAVRRVASFVTRPLPAFVMWIVPLAVWHVPALYDAALEHVRLHALEHATFTLGGVLVWTVLLERTRGWSRFAYAVGLLVPGQLLANLLIISYRPLYPAYGSLGDQNLAGLVMMAEQFATVGTLAAATAFRLIRRAEPAAGARHPLSA